MKEIVVISGKGGTGKTSLTASFAMIEGENLVVADCDVDAANLHLLLQPDVKTRSSFISGEMAVIDPDGCTGCGLCRDVCRFDAVLEKGGLFFADPIACEGCGYCARVCPANAIAMNQRLAGEWMVSAVRTGANLVHARLNVGAENSGKLVAKVKQEAKAIAHKEGSSIVLVDGAPGIGCPVISSLSGADFVVLVTEPSLSGWHDLQRVVSLIRGFHLKTGCIINKADIQPKITRRISAWLEKENIPLMALLPYDQSFTRAMTNGKTVMEEGGEYLKTMIVAAWEAIKAASTKP